VPDQIARSACPPLEAFTFRTSPRIDGSVRPPVLTERGNDRKDQGAPGSADFACSVCHAAVVLRAAPGREVTGVKNRVTVIPMTCCMVMVRRARAPRATVGVASAR
jgi:hypothetical protein